MSNYHKFREGSFEASVEITRPANVSQYDVNDIINGNGLSVFQDIDLSENEYAIQKLAEGNDDNVHIEINEVEVYSSNGSAVIKLAPIIQIYNSNAITGSTLTDNTAYDPTYAQLSTKLEQSINADEFNQSIDFGSNVYKLSANELARRCKLDANNKLYLGIIAGNTYTPSSGEIIKVVVKGRVL